MIPRYLALALIVFVASASADHEAAPRSIASTPDISHSSGGSASSGSGRPVDIGPRKNVRDLGVLSEDAALNEVGGFMVAVLQQLSSGGGAAPMGEQVSTEESVLVPMREANI